jgi:hypothetical protein
MRRGAIALALLGLASLAGCNNYKYFQIHVTFDPATLDSSQTGYISSCQVTVSGSESSSFRLRGDKCPPPSSSVAPLDVGTFEYASFVDEGSLTFKVEAFTGIGQTPDCRLAAGMLTVPVTGATTIIPTMPLVVSKVGMACTSVTPPKVDGGM